MNDNDDLSARTKALNAKLAKLEAGSHDENGSTVKEGYNAYNDGFRMVTEFCAAIVVATMLGYAIDNYLGTLPFGLIVGVLLGFVTGVYNLLRIGKKREMEEAAKQSSLSENEDA